MIELQESQKILKMACYLVNLYFISLIVLSFFYIMNLTSEQLVTATRLELEIWDAQKKITYTKLPTRKARKSECWLTQTKG